MLTRSIRFLIGCTLFALLLGAMGAAQDDSSSSTASSKSESATDNGNASPTSDNLTDPNAAPNPAEENIEPSLIRRLGSPFAFSVTPMGTKVGPLTITDLSSSGFFVTSAAPEHPAQTLWGSTTSADIYWHSNSAKNTWAFQTTPSVSTSGGQAFLNEAAGLAFTRQMTARWSLTITNSFSYLQNTYLLNPQNVLAYGNSGYFLQTVYAQQNGAATYDSNSMSMTYQMSGRTTLSITPQLGATFLDQFGSVDFVTYLGGGVTVNHNLSPNRSISFNSNFTRSTSSGNSYGTTQPWNTSTFGMGYQQQIGHNWWITGNISASYQSGQTSYWLPVGNIGLMRNFSTGSLVLGYSRSEAAQTLLSSGYFDQADLAYSRAFGRKFSTQLGAAEFRTIQTGSHGQGERIFGSIYYRWIHNLSWVASYNYSSQKGNQPGLNIGNSTYISLGLRWMLGRVAGL